MTATLINAFIIPEDKEEDFLENWKKPLPFKQRVQGSSPCAPTNLFKGLGGFDAKKCFGHKRGDTQWALKA